jgi:hypothetical protein
MHCYDALQNEDPSISLRAFERSIMLSMKIDYDRLVWPSPLKLAKVTKPTARLQKLAMDPYSEGN